jgi:molecular chaperone GrpE (heat shock protein)
MSAETYDGLREYDAMAEFAEKHISKPICSIFHPANCKDDELALIQELEEKTTEELEKLVALAEAEVQLEETTFDEKVGKIQQEYDNLVEEFNSNLDEIKDKHNYKYVEQLLTIRDQLADDDDDDDEDNAGGNGEL